MKVLLLGPEQPELLEFLWGCGERVYSTDEKIKIQSSLLKDIDFIVSFGYRYILKQNLLSSFPNSAINIHISLLPWNRGADPNLWSFLENTPKGVTIHYIDAGIDTGNILVQKEVIFGSNETLSTTYQTLIQTAIYLFKENWINIRDGKVQPKPQLEPGSFHYAKERLLYQHLLTEGWDTPVGKLIGAALKESEAEY